MIVKEEIISTLHVLVMEKNSINNKHKRNKKNKTHCKLKIIVSIIMNVIEKVTVTLMLKRF